MKKMTLKLTNRLLMIMAVAGLFIFSGCGEDDPEPVAATQTLWEILEEDEELSQLEAFLENNANLRGMLEAEGDLTLFAPTNAAFDKLKTTLGVPDLSLIKPEVIAGALEFHLSQTARTKAELTGGTFMTEQGEEIDINDNGTIFDGGSDEEVEILEADIRATNGIMHKVETILIPPATYGMIVAHLGKVSQTILLGADFSYLAQALTTKAEVFAASASLPSLLGMMVSDTEIITLFAPTNATFEAAAAGAGVTVEQFINSLTDQQWYGIIANHIVTDDGNASDANDIIDEAEMTTGASFTTVVPTGSTLTFFNNTTVIPANNGVGIYIDSDGDVNFSDPATFTNLDAEVAVIGAVEPANGVIHVIAGLLTP